MDRFVLFCMLGLVMASCDKEQSMRDPYFDPALASELKTATDTLVLGGNKLILQSFMWRDFMPVSPAEGGPLISINKIMNTDSTALPSGIELIKQHVIYGELVWTAEYSEISIQDTLVLEGVSREGPRWGPDILVDVVSEFTHSGVAYRIIARNQEIIATQ